MSSLLRRYAILFWLTAAILFIYVAGLAFYSVPFTGDTKIYLNIASENWIAREWWQPMAGGVINYFKPMLQTWSVLLGWRIFGYSIFGGQIFSLGALAWSAWAVARLSRSWMGVTPRAAWIAALAFTTSFGALTYGLANQMEIWLAALYVGATASWAEYLEKPTARRLALWITAFQWGLLALVKGPLHAVLWGLGAVLVAGTSKKRGEFFKNRRWLEITAAALAAVAVGVSWYVAMWLIDHDRFVAQFIVREHLAKQGGNGSQPWDPWVAVLLFLPPWLGVWAAGRRGWMRVAAFVLPAALFFFGFPYRLETYLFFVTPFYFVWASPAFGRPVFVGDSWVARIYIVLIGVLAPAILGLLLWLGQMMPAIGLVIWWSVSCVVIWALVKKRDATAYLGAAVLLLAGVRFAAIWIGKSDLRDLRLHVAHAPGLVIWDRGGGNLFHELGTLSVAIGKPGVWATQPGQLRAALESGRVLVWSEPENTPASAELKKATGLTQLHWKKWLRWKRGFLAPRWSDIAAARDPHSTEYERLYRREAYLVSLERDSNTSTELSGCKPTRFDLKSDGTCVAPE